MDVTRHQLNIALVNVNAATLRNKGKCQRTFFQGVEDGSGKLQNASSYLYVHNHVNSDAQKEMSEKGLPVGHWKNVLGKFKTQALTPNAWLSEMEQPSMETVASLIAMPPPCAIIGNVRETSSSGPLEEGSGKVQKASARIHWQCCQK